MTVAPFSPTALSSDGALLAVRSTAEEILPFSNAAPFARTAGIIEIADAGSGKLISQFATAQYRVPYAFTFSPDGKSLAASLLNNTLYADRDSEPRNTRELAIYDLERGTNSVTVSTKYGFGEPIFSRDGTYVALIANIEPRQAVEVFHADDGSSVLRLEDAGRGRFRFSEQARTLQLLGFDGTLKQWPLLPHNSFDADHYARFGTASISGNGELILRTQGIPGKTGALVPTDENALFDNHGKKVASPILPWLDGLWHLNHDGSAVIAERVHAGDGDSRSIYVGKLLGNTEPIALKKPRNSELLQHEWTVSKKTPEVAAIVRVTIGEREKELLVVWNQETGASKQVDLNGSVYPAGGLPTWLYKTSDPNQLQFSDCGKVIVVALHSEQSGKQDAMSTTLVVYDASTLTPIREISIPGNFLRFKVSPDLKRVAGHVLTGDTQRDSRVEVWDFESNSNVSRLEQSMSPLTFTPDGKRLISIRLLYPPEWQTYGDEFVIWDVETGAKMLSRTYFGGGGKGDMGFRFLPGTKRLIALGYFGLPQFWDGTPVKISEAHLANSK